MSYQYRKPAPILAPGVVDRLDRNGDFIERIYDGRRFDRNGNEKFGR